MKTPKGLLGWTQLVVASDVNAYDPGITHSEYYHGETMSADLMLGQSLLSLVTDKWWRSEIAPRFDRLILKEADAEGATLLYGDTEVRIGVNETKRLDIVPLSYADSRLYVTLKKTYGEDVFSTRFDIFTAEEYEQTMRRVTEGDADALNRLAYNIYYGNKRFGIEKDHAEAHRLWDKAAEAGNADALFCMGIDYQYGDESIGIEVDMPLAFDYYKRAAEAGNISAFEKLGDIYMYGIEGHLEADNKKAFKYHQQAAAEQVQGSITTLGMMYFEGVGTKQNYEKAYEMFHETAYSEHEWSCGYACYYMGEIYRRGLAGKAENMKEAFRFYEHAAELEISEAVSQLGVMLAMGWGCEVDVEKAKEYWEKAVEMGVAGAAHYLAMYYDDEEFGNDPEKAEEYQQMAADMGDEDAQFEIEHGLRPWQKLEDKEQEVGEDSYAAEDWEQRLEATMDNPTEHARVIWKGAVNKNSECLSRYAWVAYHCNDKEELCYAIELLAQSGDAKAEVFMQGKKELEEEGSNFNPLAFYPLVFFTKDGSSYDVLYDKMAHSLFRLYINKVGFFETDEPEQEDANTEPPSEEMVKYWYSLHSRSDCSSNQIGIYQDALPYAKGGNADAEFIVGYLLSRGIKESYSTVYLEPDKAKAKPFLLNAAKKGIVLAYRELLNICQYNSDEWLQYARKGAELEDMVCMEQLQDWEQNYGSAAEAARLCMKRVERNDRKAMLEMAKRYETGDGVEVNEAEAFRLVEYVYDHSSVSPYDDSHENAGDMLQRYYENGIGCEKDPDAAWRIHRELTEDEDDMWERLSR